MDKTFEDLESMIRYKVDLNTVCGDGCILQFDEADTFKPNTSENTQYNDEMLQNFSQDLSIMDDKEEEEEEEEKSSDTSDKEPTKNYNDNIKSENNAQKNNSKTSNIETTSEENAKKLEQKTKTSLKPQSHLIISFDELSSSLKKLTEDGGVKKQILRKGVGETIGSKANVSVHYNAYLEYADEPFDSTRIRGTPLVVDIGYHSVVEGLEIAVASMKKKEVARFLIEPDYAYGPIGCPPRIPPNSPCLFVVEVLNFTKFDGNSESYFKLPLSERNSVPLDVLKEALISVLNQAGKHFKRQDYSMASKSYSQALLMLENYRLKDEDEEIKVKQMQLKVLTDCALCSLNKDQPQKTLHYCSRLLSIKPQHAKGLYLKGKALRQIGEFEKAKTTLLRSNKCMPGCPLVLEELALVNKQLAKTKMCVKSNNNEALSNYNDDVGFLHDDDDEEEEDEDDDNACLVDANEIYK